MATITLLRSMPSRVNLLTSSDFGNLEDAPILSRTSTQLVFSASDQADDRFSFFGTGFTYTLFNGIVVDVPTGQITSIVYNNPSLDKTYLNWTGLDVSASAVLDNILSRNWSALNTLLFSTGDTYNLTNSGDSVRGFGGKDVMRGFGGNDRLFGDDANDKLFGDEGADKLDGGAGADTLIGGEGLDTVTGGGGADVFAFNETGATHRDIVTDFRAADDALHFDNDAFGAFSYTGQLRNSGFVAGTAAADSADRFIYQKSTGNLWYDRDGSGAAAKVLVAELADGTALTAADIFIL